MEFLGIDFGGTKAAFLLAGQRAYRQYEMLRWPAAGDPAADLAAVAQVLRRMLRGRHPTAAGVAVPALLDDTGQVIDWPSRPAWRGVRLREFLTGQLPGTAVRFADDGDLAALSEARQAGRDLLYVGVGTGVGGGLVMGGRLLRGAGGPVAEIGHIIVAAGGPACRCGRRGCLQSIASGPATLRRASTGARDVQALRGALAAGEAEPVRAVRETASALAVAIVTVSELLHPALVRLGGGFAHALPELCPAVAAEVRALDRPGHPGPRVEPAAFGALSSLIGAVQFAREPWCLDAAEEGVA